MEWRYRIMRSWKKFKNYEVLIDENKLICATGKGRPLYPYRWSKQANAWIKTVGVNFNTFRSGYNKNYNLF